MQIFEEYDRKQRRMDAALRMVTGQIRELRSEHEALCRCLHQSGFVLDLKIERSRVADSRSKQESRTARFDDEEGTSLEPNAMSKPPSVAEEQISEIASFDSQQQVQGRLTPLQGRLPLRSRSTQKQQPQRKLQQLPQHVPQQYHRRQLASQTSSPALKSTRRKEHICNIVADDAASPPQSPRGNAYASPRALPSENASNPDSIFNLQNYQAVPSSKVANAAQANDLHELVSELVGDIPARRGQTETLAAVQQVLNKPRALQAWSGDKDPLLMAVEAGRADLVRLLLKAQADSQVQDQQGVPILHLSAFEGHQDITRQLLLARADANCTDCHGQTPIFFAPDIKVCRILMEASADLTILNTMGQSALHLAALAGLSDVFVWLSKRMDQTLVWLEDICHASAMQYARQKGLVFHDGALSEGGRESGKHSSSTSPTYKGAKPTEDKLAYASPSPKFFLDGIVTPASKHFQDVLKPDDKGRNILTTIMSKHAQKESAEHAARKTLRPCSTMPDLGANGQLPIMSPLDVPRFSPKQAAGPGRPQSLPRMSTSEKSAKCDKSTTSAQSTTSAKPVLTSPSKQVLVGGVVCTSIPIPQQRTSKARSAGDSEEYRISVPTGSDLGFRVVQHLNSPLTIDRIDPSRKDLHRIGNGDVVLAINNASVANLDDYNKHIKAALDHGSFELQLRRIPARDKQNTDPGQPSRIHARRPSGHDSIGSNAAFSDIGVLEADEVDDWAQLGFDEFSPPPRNSNSSAYTLDWAALAQSGSDAPDSPKPKKKKSARGKQAPKPSPRTVASSSADVESPSSGTEQLWEPGELSGDFTEDIEDIGNDVEGECF